MSRINEFCATFSSSGCSESLYVPTQTSENPPWTAANILLRVTRPVRSLGPSFPRLTGRNLWRSNGMRLECSQDISKKPCWFRYDNQHPECPSCVCNRTVCKLLIGGLFCWSKQRHFSKKSCNSALEPRDGLSIAGLGSDLIRLSTSSGTSWKCGGTLSSISITIIPRDHVSVWIV